MWAYQHIDRNDIMHYGVPGMKWGVRRAQKRELLKGAARNRRDIDTHDKALAKLDRIEKYDKATFSFTKSGTKKYNRRMNKERASLQKGKAILESMREQKYSSLSKKQIDRGERYLYKDWRKESKAASKAYAKEIRRQH